MKRCMLFFLVAIFGIGFISSCNDQGKKCRDPRRCPEKHQQDDDDQYQRPRRW